MTEGPGIPAGFPAPRMVIEISSDCLDKVFLDMNIAKHILFKILHDILPKQFRFVLNNGNELVT